MMLRACLVAFLLLGGLAPGAAGAQALLQERYRAEVMQAFDRTPKESSLPCQFSIPGVPRLDFLFRYIGSYTVTCKWEEPVTPGVKLRAFLRITPEQGSPALMIERYDVPQLPQHNASSVYAKPNQIQFQMHGSFVLGPGRYKLETVLTDEHNHTCRAEKTLVTAEDDALRKITPPLKPGAVAPLRNRPWDGALARYGLRLTILLNVNSTNAPGVYNQENPIGISQNMPRADSQNAQDNRTGGPSGHNGPIILGPRRDGKLQETSFDGSLLPSLNSLLSQLACQSVKLIAFDADRQKEIFHQDSFDARGYLQLDKSLRNLDTSTISAESLKKGAWLQFLVDLTGREIAASKNSDAVIFLGVWGSHYNEKVSRELFESIPDSPARIFYLAFSARAGADEDAIGKLTHALHGKTFPVNSPQTLADVLKKLKAEIPAANSN